MLRHYLCGYRVRVRVRVRDWLTQFVPLVGCTGTTDDGHELSHPVYRVRDRVRVRVRDVGYSSPPFRVGGVRPRGRRGAGVGRAE